MEVLVNARFIALPELSCIQEGGFKFYSRKAISVDVVQPSAELAGTAYFKSALVNSCFIGGVSS